VSCTTSVQGQLERIRKLVDRARRWQHECPPLEALEFVAELRAEVAALERAAAADARAADESWQAIADALGISKQSAYERLAPRVRRD
jgi:hypothetical protein